MENLSMIKGDTFSFTIQIYDLEENLSEAYFSCKKNKSDETYIFQKSIGDGIELEETTDEYISYRITVAPEDTNTIESGKYYYDLQLTTADGDVFTPLNAVLTIIEDVTDN